MLRKSIIYSASKCNTVQRLIKFHNARMSVLRRIGIRYIMQHFNDVINTALIYYFKNENIYANIRAEEKNLNSHFSFIEFQKKKNTSKQSSLYISIMSG